MPKVSIVTPSFNQAKFLPETLRSVGEQMYPGIEHIVVDGGSTDGSVDILRAASGIQWVSERDRGQVDALNKGFDMATGDILAWLNSDDTMNRDTVSTAVAALDRTKADLVYGDLDIVDEDGRLIRKFYGVPHDFRILLCGINYIGQQTVFFRRTLLRCAGPLREDLDNAFDYELWLRMGQYGKYAYIPGMLAQIRKHADAKSIAHAKVTQDETDRLRKEYWADSGLPSFLGRQPFFLAVNYWYRLKRQLRIRRSK